jgi:hypothetical protein
MNKIFIPAILAIILVSGIGVANAIPFLDNIGKVNQPFPFKVTLKVLAVENFASGKDGDGSYFLVFGIDPKGNERIIEIQNNMGSSIGNIFKPKEINRDFNYFRSLANIGNNITYECNGFDNVDAIEEYPQCYKVLEIKKLK